ncbi:MAG: hypothetical protein A2901_05465 [Elusimicrobia bacterium RIFCSPLOWO2_01_FULL_54_10]|nr:MAG: hypothetical protein A2901_05465 [Elusimicrobia bacterium RIFCSPLOWO2_01_FULL_54_10]
MKLLAPHQTIQTHNEKEKFLVELFDTLYARYRSRMEYVRKYEEVVKAHGAVFFNDHIAFRTIAADGPATGIFMISRIFEALGYSSANAYEFPDKHLSSIHYQHPNPQFPKIFITQLKSWELSAASLQIIRKAFRTHRPSLTDPFLRDLYDLEGTSAASRAKLLEALVRYFEKLPWDLPHKADILALDKESQYGAWVLVNGYDVNHFTASVNSHNVDSLNDIEKLISEMRKAGIPMKKEIEGERGTKLRQSSTESAVIDVHVKDGSKTVKIPWTYAYFEIAERPLVKNPATGEMERFEGFLGGQATNLFEMTKRK